MDDSTLAASPQQDRVPTQVAVSTDWSTGGLAGG